MKAIQFNISIVLLVGTTICLLSIDQNGVALANRDHAELITQQLDNLYPGLLRDYLLTQQQPGYSNMNSNPNSNPSQQAGNYQLLYSQAKESEQRHIAEINRLTQQVAQLQAQLTKGR